MSKKAPGRPTGSVVGSGPWFRERLEVFISLNWPQRELICERFALTDVELEKFLHGMEHRKP